MQDDQFLNPQSVQCNGRVAFHNMLETCRFYKKASDLGVDLLQTYFDGADLPRPRMMVGTLLSDNMNYLNVDPTDPSKENFLAIGSYPTPGRATATPGMNRLHRTPHFAAVYNNHARAHVPPSPNLLLKTMHSCHLAHSVRFCCVLCLNYEREGRRPFVMCSKASGNQMEKTATSPARPCRTCTVRTPVPC